MHYGVLGMKWGVRKDIRQAKKDARAMAKAKVGYGAQSRTKKRKLEKSIKNKSSLSDAYKKAYEEAYKKQPHEKFEEQSRKRHLKDIKLANKDNQLYMLDRILGGTAGSIIGTTLAVKAISTLGGENIKMPSGKVIRWDPDMYNTVSLGVFGGYTLGQIGPIIRNRRIKAARRRLGYRY